MSLVEGVHAKMLHTPFSNGNAKWSFVGVAGISLAKNKPCPLLLSLSTEPSRPAMAEGKESILWVITWAFACEHSSDDWRRCPDTERCRPSTGRASAGTEPVLRTRPETEAPASWSQEHPRHFYRPTQTPTSDRIGVPKPSGPPADVEGHRRRSQKSCSKPSSTCESSRDSSFSWHYLNTSLWSHW